MKFKFITVFAGILLLCGCSTFFKAHETEERATSSLVKYLYPDGHYEPHKVEVPTLKLPVRVGIAFIPDDSGSNDAINIQQEVALLEGVRKSFLEYDYIDRIEIIPSTYLAGGGGFTTLQQVARLYDVDVMALVSYDQISRSRLNTASLFYWTIVGAYLIPGDSNVTRTFVDTAVFDVESRKLLFRAPGTDKTKRFANAVGASNQVRVSSENSFQDAVAQMSVNLNQELSQFKDRVKNNQVARIEIREGYSGGGSPDVLLFLIMLTLIASGLLIKKLIVNLDKGKLT